MVSDIQDFAWQYQVTEGVQNCDATWSLTFVCVLPLCSYNVKKACFNTLGQTFTLLICCRDEYVMCCFVRLCSRKYKCCLVQHPKCGAALKVDWWSFVMTGIFPVCCSLPCRSPTVTRNGAFLLCTVFKFPSVLIKHGSSCVLIEECWQHGWEFCVVLLTGHALQSF